MSTLNTILIIILFILILVTIVLYIFKRKETYDKQKQNRRMYPQNPSSYNQPPQPMNQQQSYNVKPQSDMYVPKKVTFEMPAFVRSIQTTSRNSFIIGVEIESNDKISLNQQIALLGEEIIKEDIKLIESKTSQQSNEPQIEDRLEEILTLMKQNPTETKKILLNNPIPQKETQQPPVDYSNEDIINTVENKTKNTVQKKSKKKIDDKNLSWDKKRPQKEFECTVCHTKRKTRWTPKTPDEPYVCFKCV